MNIIATDAQSLYFDQLHSEKYRDKNQTYIEHCKEFAKNIASNDTHAHKIFNILYNRRFLPAGRVQAALGAKEREVSPFNCSVSQVIEDDMRSIMGALSNAAMILRLGTGIGYNFSHIRPKGALIKKLQTEASGPLSFMKIFDVMASTIASSGHRRGAQMGVMDVSHPDIEAYISAKMEQGAYRQFNLSVNCTDRFMKCVELDLDFALEFEGVTHKVVRARDIWSKIIHNAYNSAEPGVLFLDTTNAKNNLRYCETIEATNPCSEQGLPPYGLCLLGSFNLVEYLDPAFDGYTLNMRQFRQDIHVMVEAYDNIYEKSVYAIPEHKEEAINKRRMGLGLTGIANAIEAVLGGPSYGNKQFCQNLEMVANILKIEAYTASVNLAKTRGAFTKFELEYVDSEFIQTLPPALIEEIKQYGIRNSHLISYAPCGTISQCAGNVSSGVEPVFDYFVDRDVHMKGGKIEIEIQDFGHRHLGINGKTLEECSVDDHLHVAEICQRHCDSAVSKTVNVASTCPYEDYERIYFDAWKKGLKGITVYRPNDITGIVIKRKDRKAHTNCPNGVCEL